MIEKKNSGISSTKETTYTWHKKNNHALRLDIWYGHFSELK